MTKDFKTTCVPAAADRAATHALELVRTNAAATENETQRAATHALELVKIKAKLNFVETRFGADWLPGVGRREFLFARGGGLVSQGVGSPTAELIKREDLSADREALSASLQGKKGIVEGVFTVKKLN